MSGSKPVWFIVAKAEDENGLHYLCIHSISKETKVFGEWEVMAAVLIWYPFMTARLKDGGEIIPQKEVRLLLRTKKSSSEKIEDNLRDVVEEEFGLQEYIEQKLFPGRLERLREAFAENLDRVLELGEHASKVS